MIRSKYMQLKAKRWRHTEWHPYKNLRGQSLPQIDNDVYAFLDVRCPACMPTTSHQTDFSCRTCKGTGEVDLETARKFIFDSEDKY